MFSDIKNAIINFITHRLFALTVVFFALMAILVYRLFSLQIINGQDYLDNFTIMSKKTITTSGQRGNIYDCNGNLLAYNRLTYSLTFSNDSRIEEQAQSTGKTENAVKNEILYKLIQILEKNGDSIVNSFEIKRNKKGEFVFTNTDENAILSFKKEVYSVSSVDKLTKEQKEASAQEVFEYLKNGNADISEDKMFGVSDDYDDKTALKMVAIRYMLFLNRYNQYVPVTIAMDISEESVAAVKEAANELPGADIESDSVREYNYSPYFSQIVGYTGIISEEEKDTLNKGLPKSEQYTGNEVIGKTGLEQEFEDVLRGKNGTKTVLVDSVGQILQTNDDETLATTGNDIYLTIDAELEKKCYTIMEKYLAGIILSHFQNTNVKRTSSPINITTTDVYFALFDNNIIDMDHLHSAKASSAEKRVYNAIVSSKKSKLKTIRSEILSARTTQKTLSDENQDYMSYIYKMLCDNGIVKSSEVDSNDVTYQDWSNDKISLGEFLEYAIHKGWIDSSNFELSTDYYDTDEMMQALMDYIEEELLGDDEFSKKILEYLIDDGVVSGKDCCMILYDQGILESEKDEDYDKLVNGTMSAYSFMYQKIKKLEITPSQLALDPCSGSIVVTDVKTGKVKALVSYPSYDNNKLANNLDDEYYSKLISDKTSPFLNRCTQSSTAPGSTFKMVTAAAGLTEGVVSNSDRINCKGIYDTIPLSPKCSVYPGRHGRISITKALEVSCNIFFFEVGHRLGTRSDGTYDEEYGLKRLGKYAAMFGLDKTSGIELDENSPHISNQDVVRSAIGQGNNSYTPAQLSRYVTTIANSGTCYDLSILDKQTDSEGKTVKKYKKSVCNEVKLDSSVWNQIHEGMYQVVHGEAHGSIFKSLHTEVAGKTGTAEEDKTRAAHALFVSYAPYENPEISVTVVVPYGYSSANAMEIARDVYKYYFSSSEKAAEKKDKKSKKTEDDEQAVVPVSNTLVD